jgi:hypothetical protein
MKNVSFKYKIFLGIAFVVILYAISSITFIRLYMTKVLHEDSVEDGRALITAIGLFSLEIRNSRELNISSLQKILKTIEDASQKLSGLLIKFDNLKEYKVVHFDDVTKITDIG